MQIFYTYILLVEKIISFSKNSFIFIWWFEKNILYLHRKQLKTIKYEN